MFKLHIKMIISAVIKRLLYKLNFFFIAAENCGQSSCRDGWMRNRRCPMERSYQAFQSLQGSSIVIGGDYGNRDRERPSTRMFINVTVRACPPRECPPLDGSDASGPEMDVCLGLTIPQVAFIVKMFFWEFISYPPKNIFSKFLQRLLEKRWAVMTSNVYKRPSLDEEGYNYLLYHKGI